jgi:hypothetical protein
MKQVVFIYLYYVIIFFRFWITFLIHIGETIYVIVLAIRLNLDLLSTIKWSIQTFLIGILSLRLILNYSKQKIIIDKYK